MQRSGLKPPTSRITKPSATGAAQVTGLPKPGGVIKKAAASGGVSQTPKGIKPAGSTQNLATTNGMKPASSQQSLNASRPGIPSSKGKSSVKAPPPTAVPSIKVGDSVLIGGSKEGTVAFLGSTKFAPGQWAGVVLSEAIGKNDGSVQGVRYFQCKPNHGLFSRPEKLQKISKVQPVETSVDRKASTSSVSSSALVAKSQQFKIGERVVIGGAKVGILRFLGKTEFANGVWAGIELDEAVGKNDGSVAGKRYFECLPKHGLFAPLLKVEKVSDSLKAADISQNSEAIPAAYNKMSSLPRSIGEETASITSAGSVARKAGLALRYTGSSSPVHSVSSAVSSGSIPISPVASQYQQVLLDAEQKILVLQGQVDSLEKEKNSLKNEVVDLKRQTEDLQFQVVESSVTGDEFKAVSDVERQQLKALQEENEKLQNTIKQIEVSSDAKEGRSTELEAQLTSLRKQVGVLQEELYSHQDLLRTERSRVKDLQTQLVEKNSSSGETSNTLKMLQDQLGESEAMTDTLKREKSNLTQEVSSKEALIGKLEGFLEEAKLRSDEERDRLVKARDEDVGKVKERLYELEVTLDKKNKDIKESAAKIIKLSEELREATVMKTGLQQKLTDLQQQLIDKEEKINTSHSDLQNAKSEFAELKRQYQTEVGHMETLQNDKMQLESQLSELVKMSGDSSQQLSYLNEQLREKDREIEELQTQQAQLNEEVSRASDELILTKDYGDLEYEKLKENSQRIREELENKIEHLTTEIEEQRSTFNFEIQQLEAEKQSVVGECKAETAGLENRIQLLKKELEAVTSQLSSEEMEKKEALSKAEMWEDEYKNAKSAVTDLQVEVSSIKQQVREATDAWKESEDRASSRHREAESLQLELDAVKKERNLLSKDLQRTVLEKNEINAERELALREKETVLTERNCASAEQTALLDERSKLQTEREKLLIEKRSALAECDKLQAEREELVEKLSREQVARQDAILQSQEMSLKYESLKSQHDESSVGSIRLSNEIESLKESLDAQQQKFKENMEKVNVRNSELNQLLQSAEKERLGSQNEAQKLSDRLWAMKSTNEELENALKSASTEVKQLTAQLEESKLKIQSLEANSDAEKSVWQKRAETAEKVLEKKEREVVDARDKAAKLENELEVRRSEYEGQMQNLELLEEDKANLELRVAELMVDLETLQKASKKSRDSSPQIRRSHKATDDTRLMEAQEELLKTKMEEESQKQQIEFLNSVISDMQRKLEVAESLALAQGGDDMNYSYENDDSHESSPMTQALPPRLFCDICDVFDQHDTDDCPLQANELEQLESHTQYHGHRGAERPYCETCEAFGHWTEECPYDATY